MCKKLTTLFIVVIITINSFGQALNPIVNYKHYIENEEVISENKLNARASFTSYTTVEDALTFSNHRAQFHQLLDGQWKFNWTRSPKERPITFMDPNENIDNWDSIKVPANWEVEGFGIPIYVNHQYEFADYKAPVAEDMELIDRVYPKSPGDVPDNYNPVGSYRREFNLDANWLENEIFIHIGAMKSGGFIWVNGEYVGYSQGSKLPSEFNITNFAKEGKNTIALQIFRWTDGSYLECQDFWRISGIERSIFVYAQPKLRIEDFNVVASLDKAYENGIFELDVDIQNHSFSIKKFSLFF